LSWEGFFLSLGYGKKRGISCGYRRGRRDVGGSGPRTWFNAGSTCGPKARFSAVLGSTVKKSEWYDVVQSGVDGHKLQLRGGKAQLLTTLRDPTGKKKVRADEINPGGPHALSQQTGGEEKA